jgi:hypothetical protein
VYSFCVGVYIVSVPSYNMDNEGYLEAVEVDFFYAVRFRK